jgi:probable HAF family extracellular repeat protein
LIQPEHSRLLKDQAMSNQRNQQQPQHSFKQTPPSNFGRRRLGVAIALCLAAAGGVSVAHAQSYTYTNLGSLGGNSSYAYGINNLGVIVGSSSIAGDTATHATLWNGGSVTDLGTLGGFQDSIAFGINDAGQVVGRSTASGVFRATLWSGGSVTDLGLGNASTATAINTAGQIAATKKDVPPTQATTGMPGSFNNIFPTSVWRTGINDAGQVVGGSGAHAVVYSAGVVSVLADLPGTIQSFASAINSSGQIVGDSIWCGACNDQATFWNGASVVALASLGGTDSVAVDINDASQIVGTSRTAGGDYHATLWEGGSVLDLNSFLSASMIAAGWVLSEAGAINDNGWIVGTATNSLTLYTSGFLLQPTTPFAGRIRALAVTPVPEPATYGMLAAGLGLVGWMARRRQPVAAKGASDRG